jgi:hypothetical protein
MGELHLLLNGADSTVNSVRRHQNLKLKFLMSVKELMVPASLGGGPCGQAYPEPSVFEIRVRVLRQECLQC